MVDWNPTDHPRGHDGKFVDSFVGRISDQIGDALGSNPLRDYAWGVGGSGGSVALELNGELRAAAGGLIPRAPRLDGQAQKLRDGLDAGFAAAPPLEKPLKVYRVVASNRDMYYDLNGAGHRGERWSDPGYMSTTTDRSVAQDFDLGEDYTVELEITVPKGKKALNVDQALGDEIEYPQKEYLLPRGTTLKLGKPQTVGRNRILIKATVVS